MGPLLLLSNQQSPATKAVADRLDTLANELSGGPSLAEVTVAPNQSGLTDNTGRDSRESRTVDGIVMADLELLERAFARRNGELEAHAPA